ncbi:hypothetical protein GE061_002294 [Apolygus lucorum]|uniref:Uncharacterized protein n=1 Tax=Apolygus lucorum TaxID=248454 RepID=A0A8S9X7B4_APOLU|nr:hypothetical protein GE061_002294 [Apolygus lucorum]
MNSRGYTSVTPAIWGGNTARTRTSNNTGRRPVTSRSLEDCKVKDLGYFKRKLSMKITQVKAELYAMKEKIKELQIGNKRVEYRATLAQDKAKELTELQDLLNVHFTALDRANMRNTISDILKETAKLKEENDVKAKEQEEFYNARMYHKQKVEKLKMELSSVISDTALRDVQRAVQNDPEKIEQIQMELQLEKLIKERESLMEKSKVEYKGGPYRIGIEGEIDLLHDILSNSLKDVSHSLRDVSKLEHCERFMSENPMNRVQNYSPQQSLKYLEYYLSNLKFLDKYVTKVVEQHMTKSMDLKGLCVNALNESNLSDVQGRKLMNLKSEKSIIDCQRRTTSEKLDSKEAEFRTIEKQLMSHESYKKQRELENLLMNLNGMNHSLNEFLEEGRAMNDLEKRKERVLTTVNRLNAIFISNMSKESKQA